MKQHDFLNWLGCGFGTVLTAVQTNQIFQTISLILTCIATALTIAYTVWKWWKKASADGKIDEEEVKELINIVDDSKEKIENIGDKKNGKNQ